MNDHVPSGTTDRAEAERAQRARGRRLGCALGLFVLGSMALLFAWKLYLLGTPPGGGPEPSGETTGR